MKLFECDKAVHNRESLAFSATLSTQLNRLRWKKKTEKYCKNHKAKYNIQNRKRSVPQTLFFNSFNDLILMTTNTDDNNNENK